MSPDCKSAISVGVWFAGLYHSWILSKTLPGSFSIFSTRRGFSGLFQVGGILEIRKAGHGNDRGVSRRLFLEVRWLIQ